ncbi:lysozyme [Ancylobacter rudongensis]|uniref:Lysozyme n=1 Tax=Ancylobacter rudongensis TaxID=177413 RepID=A0A1G4UPU7_9HYPH|nr:lysozyme [Ancylobacter rudongensis]SCW95686.1 Phage-related lysozyme (muramidase), GH24 family [Ancylobacter rudongensis]
MPVSKLRPTKRASAAIAAVMAMAVSIGGALFVTAPNGKQYPAAVVLAAEHIVKDWEGLHLTAYRDMVGIWTICYGETLGVKPGMRKTRAECEAMLYERLHRDFYLAIVKCAPQLAAAPISVQASMLSGSFNFGVGAWCRSTASRHIRVRAWRPACDAQTLFNRAGGRVVQGLVNRREMGDAQRLGEGELCVSGIK